MGMTRLMALMRRMIHRLESGPNRLRPASLGLSGSIEKRNIRIV